MTPRETASGETGELAINGERLTIRFSELPAVFALIGQIHKDVQALYDKLRESPGRAS